MSGFDLLPGRVAEALPLCLFVRGNCFKTEPRLYVRMLYLRDPQEKKKNRSQLSKRECTTMRAKVHEVAGDGRVLIHLI